MSSFCNNLYMKRRRVNEKCANTPSKQRRYCHLPIDPVPSLPMPLARFTVDSGLKKFAIHPLLNIIIW